MKAKDLTQADNGKWVTLRGKIVEVRLDSVDIEIEGEGVMSGFLPSTTLEFTDPPAPVQEVGDVFQHTFSDNEWTIAAIVGDACLLQYLTGHLSADYPLDPDLWTLVRKGTNP